MIPALSAYVLAAAVVVYAARHPAGSATTGQGWRARVRLIAVTVGGGYGCFLGIVIVFHVWIVGDRGALLSALRGGGLLAIAVAATFLLLSILQAKSGRLR